MIYTHYRAALRCDALGRWVVHVIRAWKKPDTVIVADYVWSATARHADIVLPACTTFEHNDITNIGAETNDGLVAMKQVIKPQYESRSDYWIGTQLA